MPAGALCPGQRRAGPSARVCLCQRVLRQFIAAEHPRSIQFGSEQLLTVVSCAPADNNDTIARSEDSGYGRYLTT